MTWSIGLVLGILLAALVLFVTEWIRADLVALLVMGILAVLGLVTPTEALSGFSNSAVVTVWAMFILSAGLSRTGVADTLGRRLLPWAGTSETRMIIVIMLVSGVLSAFMNNIGVAALMLPVVLGLARNADVKPSRLLMPLAYGCLLGGLTTLIGTPPNLLASEALDAHGLQPFAMFDFTPMGGAVMLGGIIFVALIGRHLLPRQDPGRETAPGDPSVLWSDYALGERSAMLRVADNSPLVGVTLRDSRLRTAAALNVYAVIRGGRSTAAPDPGMRLEAGDHLVVAGALDRFEELRAWRDLEVDGGDVELDRYISEETGLAELEIRPESDLAGNSLAAVSFRSRFGCIVVALRRQEEVVKSGLALLALQVHDRLLVQGSRRQLAELSAAREFTAVLPAMPPQELAALYGLERDLFTIRVPEDSFLAEKTLAETRIGDALGLGVLGIVRDQVTHLLPAADEKIQAGDLLLARGRQGEIDIFHGLRQLEIETGDAPRFGTDTAEEVALLEAMLAPRSSLAGSTLAGLAFRARHGLQVLAILREGKILRTDLAHIPLRFGDVLLLLGTREKIDLFQKDPGFLVITPLEAKETPLTARAPVAVLIMGAVIVPVVLGLIPISISATLGAAMLVLTGCLTMESAYRSIDWRSVFLIAGMLPLGLAMDHSGAAAFLAEGLMTVARPLGPWGVLGGIYLITAVLTCVIPTAALVVLMTPIALGAGNSMGISPYSLMMAVAMAASASFTSPISHPANILVMGPGGYRFADYFRIGVPLTLLVMIIVFLVMPWLWPLTP